MRRTILSFVAVVGLVSPVPGLAEELETSAGPVEVRRAVAGLETPWAIAFLPDGGQLITVAGIRWSSRAVSWRRAQRPRPASNWNWPPRQTPR